VSSRFSAPLRSQLLQTGQAGHLKHLARGEQVIDLAFGELGDDRPAVHLVADQIPALDCEFHTAIVASDANAHLTRWYAGLRQELRLALVLSEPLLLE
jgi:hypothetical protein